MKIILLTGGNQPTNRANSMVTHIGEAFGALSFPFWEFEFSWDRLSEFMKLVEKIKPTIIFNALQGSLACDGRIVALLDMLGVKYTHSDHYATTIAGHRAQSRILCDTAEILVPEWCLANKFLLKHDSPIPYPIMVKPVLRGSTTSAHLICDQSALNRLLANWDQGNDVIIEKYLIGREITVLCASGMAFGSQEVLSHHQFVPGSQRFDQIIQVSSPLFLNDDQEDKLLQYAERAYHALGCSGIATCDFIFSEGEFYLLGVNTNPEITPTSVVGRIIAHNGWTFEELIRLMILHSKLFAEAQEDAQQQAFIEEYEDVPLLWQPVC